MDGLNDDPSFGRTRGIFNFNSMRNDSLAASIKPLALTNLHPPLPVKYFPLGAQALVEGACDRQSNTKIFVLQI